MRILPPLNPKQRIILGILVPVIIIIIGFLLSNFPPEPYLKGNYREYHTEWRIFWTILLIAFLTITVFELILFKKESNDYSRNHDEFIKNMRAWWRSLTGKGGPGKGFADLSRKRRFIKDFKKLCHSLDPWLERYYGNMARIGELQAQSAKNPQVQKEIDKLMPQAQADLVEILKRYKPVAQKWYSRPGGQGADIRIALYREPTYRPLVEGLMEPGEKEVAEGHKWLVKQAHDLAEKQNIPVTDLDTEYVTHLLFNMLKVSRVTPEKLKRWSLNFFPSIHASTEAYISILARKVAETALTGTSKKLPE